MNETKPWYASVGVWGAVVGLIGATLSLLKIEVDPAFLDDLREWLLSAATLAGTGAALYGRLRASRRIAPAQPPPPPTTQPFAPRAACLLAALLLLPPFAGGCAALPGGAGSAAAAADRATYDAVAPEYAAYVAGDPSLDDAQRARRQRTLDAWKLRVDAGGR